MTKFTPSLPVYQIILACIVLASFFVTQVSAQDIKDANCIITEVTPNEFNHGGATINGNLVSWFQGAITNSEVIYLWDRTRAVNTRQAITNGVNRDFWAIISGNHIVWYREVGSGFESVELFYLNANNLSAQPLRITNNSTMEMSPVMSGDYLFWRGVDGANVNIYFWDASQPNNPPQIISQSTIINGYPDASGDYVVWDADDGNLHRIYFWDVSQPGTPPQMIFEMADSDTFAPKISGSIVVWTGDVFFNTDSEIYYWDASQPTVQPQKIVDNALYDFDVVISGDNIVWNTSTTGALSEQESIYYWNISQPATPPQLIIGNEFRQYDMVVSDDYLVWDSWSGTTNEIFFINVGASDNQIYRLPKPDNVDYHEPRIDGSRLVWSADHHISELQVGEILYVDLANCNSIEIDNISIETDHPDGDFLPYAPIHVAFDVTDTKGVTSLDYTITCEDGTTAEGSVALTNGEGSVDSSCIVENLVSVQESFDMTIQVSESQNGTIIRDGTEIEIVNIQPIESDDYEK